MKQVVRTLLALVFGVLCLTSYADNDNIIRVQDDGLTLEDLLRESHPHHNREVRQQPQDLFEAGEVLILDPETRRRSACEPAFQNTITARQYFRASDGVRLHYAHFSALFEKYAHDPMTAIVVPGCNLPIETFRPFILELMYLGLSVWI